MREKNCKVILVTGASSGLGLETAGALVSKGHIVYGTSRYKTDNQTGVKMLSMDVCTVASVENVVSTIMNEQGRIDILINIAGVGTGGALELTSQEEYDWTFNTNVLGLINVCRAVIPHMRKARSGKIINFSSIAGIIGIPYQGLYSASKFAIEGLSETYALELKQFGIKVCLVEPGDFATNFTSNRKMSTLTQNETDYQGPYTRCMEIIEKSENGGAQPSLLAKKVCNIVDSKNPSFRNLVGPFSQVLPVKLLAFIPTRLAQFILRSMYALESKY